MPHTRGRRQCSSSSTSSNCNNNCSRNSSASGNCCSRIKCVVASYSLAASHYMAESQSSAELPHCCYGKVGKERLQGGSCRTALNRRPQFEFAFDARSIDRLRKSFAAKYIELAADGELVKVNTSHTHRQRVRDGE